MRRMISVTEREKWGEMDTVDTADREKERERRGGVSGDRVSVLVYVCACVCLCKKSPYVKPSSHEAWTFFLAFLFGPTVASLLSSFSIAAQCYSRVRSAGLLYRNVSYCQKPRVHPSAVPLQSCLHQQHFVVDVWMQGRLEHFLCFRATWWC